MTQLLVMRLVDMVRGHPSQDNTRVCGTCGKPVGIYPTGQRALRRDPDLEIICTVCSGLDPRPIIGLPAALSFEEFVSEMRDSQDVKKA